MNAALDSPLEALALNYLTYGFLTAVNNIWAWIAVVTAAVSFWRMRALSSSPPSTAEPICRVQNAAEEEPAPAPVKAPCRVLEREGSTKMKFSLYYEEEEVEDFRGEDDGSENEECGGGAAEAVVMRRELDSWNGGSEGLVALRMGDMGWYRWQDRTVLDGSVVRLWDGRKRIHAAVATVDGGAAW